MSVSYWGDLFYGIDRVKHSNLFNKDKEKEIIIKKINNLFHTDEIKQIEEEHDINFISLAETELIDYADILTPFLIKDVQAYTCYCSNQEIMFFGVYTVLPWEVKELVTKEEIDKRIYDSIKPILKDNVEYSDIKDLFKFYVINGADDYITYYELDVK